MFYDPKINKKKYLNREFICFKLKDLTLHMTFKIGTNLLKIYGLKFF
jgi:hypothetical protein